MRSPATSLTALHKSLRRFRRNRHGSAAVEFAFIAPLFFVLLFAIIETALMFFAAQVLETGTQDSARLMLTNQAQNQNMSQADFEKDLCNRIKMLFNCAGSSGVSALTVTVKAYAAGAEIPAADLVNPVSAGVFIGKSSYTVPPPGSTVLIRTFYPWPMIVTRLGYNIANLGSGGSSPERLLAATAVFRVEPNGS